ncbi:alpha/beta hydrolase [Frankia nepalensis]|uniref:alpha/beta hydrolase n=1 Tax=Frankia nepalensis TaxID=1836974 RepID=UPI0027DC2952|nr:alpha/beta hydrolase [Frankia nepalensis]
MIRRPAADPARRIGSLVYLAGGPGDSGVDFVERVPKLFNESVRDRFDIVGFDQRGVSRSAPVRCFTDEENASGEDSIAGLPKDRSAVGGEHSLAVVPVGAKRSSGNDVMAGFDETAEVYREFAANCGRLSGPLLPYLSTEAAARDVDLLRAALGEPKLTAYGASYGTQLGATYAALFPTRLRALVLDAPADPTLRINNPLEHLRLKAFAFEAALNAFFAWCAHDPKCGFGHGDPAGAYDRLMARLAEKPLDVRDKDGTTTPVDASVARTAVVQLLYGEWGWPDLGLGLQRADDYDDGSILLDKSRGEASAQRESEPYSNSNEAIEAINCADQSYPTDLAVYRRFLVDLARQTPRIGVTQALVGLACAFWPTRPASRYTGPFQAQGAPTILVIGTTGDPATPYPEARTLAAQLGDRGVLLTWQSYTHVAYRGSTCVDEITDRYLIDLVTPKPNTVCQ